MKLIDILVQELPARGGWPEFALALTQDVDGSICLWEDVDVYQQGGAWAHPSGTGLLKYWCNNKAMKPAEDRSKAIITREQYEAALAASKSEWDGEGLPPVGCRVEANYGGEWVEATVAYTERPDSHGDAVAWREALVFDCKTTRPFWADEFRPIRSEADKKKEKVVDEIMSWMHYAGRAEVELIYDAIKSGKIVIE